MATSVSFTPDICNVTWDGVSLAQATFGLKCPGSGSYAATAYRVFTGSGAYSYIQPATPTLVARRMAVPFRAGELFFVINSTGVKSWASYRSMTATAVGSTAVSVEFSSLSLSDASFSGGLDTVYAWNLRDTGANKTLVAGRLTVSALNPYRLPSQSTGVFITGTTMTSSEC